MGENLLAREFAFPRQVDVPNLPATLHVPDEHVETAEDPDQAVGSVQTQRLRRSVAYRATIVGPGHSLVWR